MVWRNLGLNPGLPDHWWILYQLGQWTSFMNIIIINKHYFILSSQEYAPSISRKSEKVIGIYLSSKHFKSILPVDDMIFIFSWIWRMVYGCLYCDFWMRGTTQYWLSLLHISYEPSLLTNIVRLYRKIKIWQIWVLKLYLVHSCQVVSVYSDPLSSSPLRFSLWNDIILYKKAW